MKRLLILLLFAALAVGAVAWWQTHGNGNGTSFRTARVERGDLVATVSASGVVQAEEVVDIGAQVAGRIIGFGRDPQDSSKFIDFNSQVESGTELAYIDPALYRAELDQAEGQLKQAEGQLEQGRAQVASAKANVNRALADLEQFKAKLFQADRDLDRAKRLRGSGGVSESEYDLVLSAQKTAHSALGVGEASVEQVKAAQKDSDANLIRVEGVVMTAREARDRAKTNLDYCTIKSPVKGVILDRRVNVGQTVVSSFSAPSLFLLAKDLKKIQIWASVNEADIMQVRVGQPVTFTIEARESEVKAEKDPDPKEEKKSDQLDEKKTVTVKGPDGRTEVFKGTVYQLRKNANNTQNVITYTVVINTDNSDGRLWPSMSANVLFEVARRKDVLKVPQAALRWNPRRELVSPAHQEEADKLTRKRAAGKKPGDSREGVVWVEDGPGLVRPVKVEIGMSDGLMTEVKGELTDEDHVVLGVVQAKSGGDDSSPFAKMFGKKPEK